MDRLIMKTYSLIFLKCKSFDWGRMSLSRKAQSRLSCFGNMRNIHLTRVSKVLDGFRPTSRDKMVIFLYMECRVCHHMNKYSVDIHLKQKYIVLKSGV